MTTRARTRGLRYFVPMIRAFRSIERDLAANPNCLRFVSGVAGPREFFSVTVWTDHRHMVRFASDGHHARAVWERPAWLTSYWGMRWSPGAIEAGSWDGLSVLSRHAASVSGAAARPSQQRVAVGAANGARPEAARAEVGGTVGTLYHLRFPRRRALRAARQLRALRRRLASEPAVFGVVGGLGGLGEGSLLIVWRGEADARGFTASREHDDLMSRWPGSAWWMEWLAQGESGRWDGRRVRDDALGPTSGAPAAVDVRLRPDLEAPRRARRLFDDAELLLPDPVASDVRLLISELVTNSVVHARLERTDPISLRIQAVPGCVRVEVGDPGAGFARAPVEAPTAEQPSGRGLWILHQLADRWGVLTGGLTRVWFEIDVAARGRG
ncbi:MAG TPA: ATP-binding protein [Actinomycetota bacterium]|nr:ATP-binding protein [Actinomycetota bacterium]